MEEKVTFQSAGHRLAGVLHIPDGLKPGEKRAAVIVLHGFGGTMAGPGGSNPGQLFCDMGYVAFRFDFRGCGQSEGERGRIICLEEVEDAQNALSYLAGRPEVVPTRIALMGESFGAAVAVYAGGVDKRVAAVLSSGGWGDGEKKFRRQHPGDEAWAPLHADDRGGPEGARPHRQDRHGAALRRGAHSGRPCAACCRPARSWSSRSKPSKA